MRIQFKRYNVVTSYLKTCIAGVSSKIMLKLQMISMVTAKNAPCACGNLATSGNGVVRDHVILSKQSA